jgi:hypothetical protein
MDQEASIGEAIRLKRNYCADNNRPIEKELS